MPSLDSLTSPTMVTLGDLADSVAPASYDFILRGTDLIGGPPVDVPLVLEIIEVPVDVTPPVVEIDEAAAAELLAELAAKLPPPYFSVAGQKPQTFEFNLGDSSTVYEYDLGKLVYASYNAFTVSINYGSEAEGAPFFNLEEVDGSYKLRVTKELAVAGTYSAYVSVDEVDSEGITSSQTIQVRAFVYELEDPQVEISEPADDSTVDSSQEVQEQTYVPAAIEEPQLTEIQIKENEEVKKP